MVPRLIDELIKKKGYSKQEARRVLKDIEDCVVDAITDGNTLTWSGFMRFYLKKYNEVTEEGFVRFGTVHYLIGVKHLKRVTTVVRQMTNYRLDKDELAHNEKIQGLIGQQMIKKRKHK